MNFLVKYPLYLKTIYLHRRKDNNFTAGVAGITNTLTAMF